MIIQILTKLGSIGKCLSIICLCLLLQPFTRVDILSLLNQTQYQQLQQQLNIGDWIFRQGTGYEGVIIQQLSQSIYSHVGIVSQIYPQILVIHATTDDDLTRENQVIESNLYQFISPKFAQSWQIIRSTQLNQQQQQQIVQHIQHKLGRKFVLAVRDQPHLYCTTLIAQELPLDIQQQLKWKKVDLPHLQGELLYPVALLNLPHVQIYQRRYH